jgi:hypothetical protein
MGANTIAGLGLGFIAGGVVLPVLTSYFNGGADVSTAWECLQGPIRTFALCTLATTACSIAYGMREAYNGR